MNGPSGEALAGEWCPDEPAAADGLGQPIGGLQPVPYTYSPAITWDVPSYQPPTGRSGKAYDLVNAQFPSAFMTTRTGPGANGLRPLYTPISLTTKSIN